MLLHVKHRRSGRGGEPTESETRPSTRSGLRQEGMPGLYECDRRRAVRERDRSSPRASGAGYKIDCHALGCGRWA